MLFNGDMRDLGLSTPVDAILTSPHRAMKSCFWQLQGNCRQDERRTLGVLEGHAFTDGIRCTGILRGLCSVPLHEPET